MKVLIADDNPLMLDLLADLLAREGLECVKAQDGRDAIERFRAEKPDFVCLDIVMGDMSGYDICKAIRETDIAIPIVFISSKSDTLDKVQGLELGADDYITKPFDVVEVSARIRTIMRRCLSAATKPTTNAAPEEKEFRMGDLTVIPDRLMAVRGGDGGGGEIDLSLRDLKILRLLHQRKNKVVDRNTLLDVCWGQHIMPESRTLDWHISQLRKKIEQDSNNPRIILTAHGVGYRYNEDADD